MGENTRVHRWEQQLEEPQGAFEQFLLYLSQPRGDRQVKESYLLWMERQTGTRPVPGHPPGSYYETAERYQWKDRARAFDRESDRRVYAKLEARRANTMFETMEAGRILRERATAAAKMLVPVTQTIGHRDGREVILVETRLTPSEIARLAQVGIELEQLAMGSPTSRVELVGNANNPLMVTLDNAKGELTKRITEARSRRRFAQQAAED